MSDENEITPEASGIDGADSGEDQAAVDRAVEELAEPADELATVRAELHEANQRALRTQAELENFRKRMRREMDDERRYAGVSLISDLLGVADNLQRAIDAAGQNENSSALLEGVTMVAQQFVSVLEQHNCVKMDVSPGIAFDPHAHEAMSQQPSDEHPAGTVTMVVRDGFQLHDRVVRPAQVLLSSGPA